MVEHHRAHTCVLLVWLITIAHRFVVCFHLCVLPGKLLQPLHPCNTCNEEHQAGCPRTACNVQEGNQVLVVPPKRGCNSSASMAACRCICWPISISKRRSLLLFGESCLLHPTSVQHLSIACPLVAVICKSADLDRVSVTMSGVWVGNYVHRRRWCVIYSIVVISKHSLTGGVVLGYGAGVDNYGKRCFKKNPNSDLCYEKMLGCAEEVSDDDS